MLTKLRCATAWQTNGRRSDAESHDLDKGRGRLTEVLDPSSHSARRSGEGAAGVVFERMRCHVPPNEIE